MATGTNVVENNNMVKEKPNSIRTYDEDGFRRRAACLCFRDATEKEILLVTSSRYRDQWVVPGGGVEPCEEPSIAASREALEEAGVIGELGRHLGNFENPDKKHRTSVYTFIVKEMLEDWDDAKSMGRKRKWFPVSEAKEKLLYKPVQLTYLELLPVVPKLLEPKNHRLLDVIQMSKSQWIEVLVMSDDVEHESDKRKK